MNQEEIGYAQRRISQGIGDMDLRHQKEGDENEDGSLENKN